METGPAEISDRGTQTREPGQYTDIVSASTKGGKGWGGGGGGGGGRS